MTVIAERWALVTLHNASFRGVDKFLGMRMCVLLKHGESASGVIRRRPVTRRLCYAPTPRGLPARRHRQ